MVNIFVGYYKFITARKRSLGQGNILHLFVILFTGGGSASVHDGIPHPPPGPAPLGPGTPPGSDTPPDQAPPSTEHAGRYGQRGGVTYPTGMQSCYVVKSERNLLMGWV